MRKRRIKTGNFVQQAIADEGRRRRDAKVIASQKGEYTETTIDISGKTIIVQ